MYDMGFCRPFVCFNQTCNVQEPLWFRWEICNPGWQRRYSILSQELLGGGATSWQRCPNTVVFHGFPELSSYLPPDHWGLIQVADLADVQANNEFISIVICELPDIKSASRSPTNRRHCHWTWLKRPFCRLGWLGWSWCSSFLKWQSRQKPEICMLGFSSDVSQVKVFFCMIRNVSLSMSLFIRACIGILTQGHVIQEQVPHCWKTCGRGPKWRKGALLYQLHFPSN